MFEIGSTLRQSRTRQGLELRDAERETRIRTKYLAPARGGAVRPAAGGGLREGLPSDLRRLPRSRQRALRCGVALAFGGEQTATCACRKFVSIAFGTGGGVDVLGAAAPARVARAAGAVGAGEGH